MMGAKPHRRSTRIRESRGDRIFLIVDYSILTVSLLAILYPLVYVFSASFSSPTAVSAGKVWLFPVDFTLRGYKVMLGDPQIMLGYANSIFYTFFGTLISLILTVLVAYPLSLPKLYGRDFLMLCITITMIFSGGLVPTYLVVKELGMLDTRWALIIPSAVNAFYIIVARTFFQVNIPKELADAAALDGCSPLSFLWRIVIPLSGPIIAVLALMYAVAQWNAYFDALIYLRSPGLHPLQLVLRSILILNTSSTGSVDAATLIKRRELADLLRYVVIVVGSLPVLAVYPFIQRYFVKGMLIGSIKG